MQFSELERQMHNSPLKCTTNNAEQQQQMQAAGANESPCKGSSPKLQDQAYRSSGEKLRPAAAAVASPTKPSAQRRLSPTQNSPDKAPATSLYSATDASENARMEDPSYRSPPQKKFSSPKRPSAMAASSSKTSSPSKHVAPFGKPIEIIKSKCQSLSESV